MAITIDTRTGPVQNQDSAANQPLRQTRMAALAVTDAHGKYYEAAARGFTYLLSYPATATHTAFVGAGGGTPLIGVYNPPYSGKNLLLIGVSAAVRVAGASTGPTTSFALWGGPSVLPTGTVTVPTNLLSLQTTGSVAKGFVNTAMTGSTAINLLAAISSYYWITGASSFQAPGFYDLAGMFPVAPGNLVAFGATIAFGSLTTDCSLIWEEIPI